MAARENAFPSAGKRMAARENAWQRNKQRIRVHMMKTKFIDQLGQWVKEKEKQPKGHKAFLRYKDEVKEGLLAGYTCKTIWEYLYQQGKIHSQYRTFLDHVKKYIEPEKPLSDAMDGPVSGSRSTSQPKGFYPTSTPKKEDLI